MEELTRNREKADRKQHSAKLRRKQRGGGVRENIEKIKLIEHNKAKWLTMCKNRDKKRDTQKETEGDDKTNDTQGKNGKDEKKDPSSSTLPGQRTHSGTKHKPLPTNKHQ